jgi:hypothetical protein
LRLCGDCKNLYQSRRGGLPDCCLLYRGSKAEEKGLIARSLKWEQWPRRAAANLIGFPDSPVSQKGIFKTFDSAAAAHFGSSQRNLFTAAIMAEPKSKAHVELIIQHHEILASRRKSLTQTLFQPRDHSFFFSPRHRQWIFFPRAPKTESPSGQLQKVRSA